MDPNKNSGTVECPYAPMTSKRACLWRSANLTDAGTAASRLLVCGVVLGLSAGRAPSPPGRFLAGSRLFDTPSLCRLRHRLSGRLLGRGLQRTFKVVGVQINAKHVGKLGGGEPLRFTTGRCGRNGSLGIGGDQFLAIHAPQSKQQFRLVVQRQLGEASETNADRLPTTRTAGEVVSEACEWYSDTPSRLACLAILEQVPP